MEKKLPKKTLSKECFAEFLGTFLFLFLGMGCVAGLKLSGAQYSQWDISIIWGLAVAMAIYVVGGVSGAHLNPSVTVALALCKDFPKSRVLPYIISQFIGAFAAAACVYYLYSPILMEKSLNTAGIFTTFPHAHVSFAGAFLTEFMITAVLVAVVFALADENNGAPRGGLSPLLVGLTVAAIGGAFGPLTGFSMNAARDFGPRFFTYCAGWGSEVMTGGFHNTPYCLVPLIAPILGGLFGAVCYNLLRGKDLEKTIKLK